MTVAVAVFAATAGAATPAQAVPVRTVTAGTHTVQITASDAVHGPRARRLADWRVEFSSSTSDDGAPVPPPQSNRLALAERGRLFAVNAGLECDGRGGGAAFVYGTVAAEVRRVVVRTRDGDRVRLRLDAPPARWRFGGRVVSGRRAGLFRPSNVTVYGAHGRRLGGTRFRASGNCSPADGEPRQLVRAIDPGIRSGAAQRRLDQAVADWRAAGIRSYRLRVRAFGCFCFDRDGPELVRVRGRRVTPRRGPSVPMLFAEIQTAIDEEASDLDARYGRFGVPRSFFVDPESFMEDDQGGLATSRFRRG
jgi:hypothetical protein